MPGMRRIRVMRIKDDPDSSESKYQSYQDVLTNIMTMGTLLLGFIITGTMLSVGLTGQENFNTGELFYFLKWSASAAGCALFSVLLALLVSMRATDKFSNVGAAQGLRTMRNCTIYIGVSEILFYISFYFFLYSLSTFISMTYGGPDICPVVSKTQREADLRASSFCGLVGSDMFATANATCATKAADYPLLCGYHKGMVDQPLFYGWYDALDTGMGRSTQEHLSVVDTCANLFCEFDQIETIRTAMCNGTVNPLRCADATRAYRKADDCVGQTTDDLNTCYKVCNWFDHISPSERMSSMLDTGYYGAVVMLSIFALYRLFLIIRQEVIMCHQGKETLDGAVEGLVDTSDDDGSSDDGRTLGYKQ